jgi:hypothetical protein
VRHGREYGVVGSRRIDGKAERLSERGRTNQARKVSERERANQSLTDNLTVELNGAIRPNENEMSNAVLAKTFGVYIPPHFFISYSGQPPGGLTAANSDSSVA